MIEESGRVGPPHAAIIAVVLLAPMLIGDQCKAITNSIAELLSPVGLLLAIRFLSSETGTYVAGIFSSENPSYIHRARAAPIGVVVVLLLVLLLLYGRMSIFGGDDDSY